MVYCIDYIRRWKINITMGKKISIIIPCYNVEKWVDRCLTSVTEQTIGLDNIEIICVDDCSTDGTLEKLYAWEQKYPEHFVIVESPENGRQGQARNIGLQYASTDWIAFIDSDDWVEFDYLEYLFQYAQTGKYEIVCCSNIRDFSAELSFVEKTEKVRVKELNLEYDEVRKQQIINPEITYSAWGKLFRKDFLVENDLFFPTNLTYEDAGWGSLVVLYANSVCISDKCLYHYFVNGQSTVLKKNSNHHLDCLTVQAWVWREYIQRGFFESYYWELQMEHIYSCCLAGLKTLILRYEEPDYNVYLLLRELVSDRIADYKDNPYVQAGRLSELHLLMMGAFDKQLSKRQFEKFSELIKQIGI